MNAQILRCTSFWIGTLIIAVGAWAQSLPLAVPTTPQELRPPANQVLLLHLAGKGNQIYSCQNVAGAIGWKLKAPEAQLLNENGDVVGHHFAGPTWEVKDGGRIVGKVAATLASPNAGSIPWLLVAVISHEGTGVLSTVQSIQRLDTKGGVAPVAGCDAGHVNKEVKVPYEAQYYFYGPHAGV